MSHSCPSPPAVSAPPLEPDKHLLHLAQQGLQAPVLVATRICFDWPVSVPNPCDCSAA